MQETQDFSVMAPIILQSAPREPPAPHQAEALLLKEHQCSHEQLLWGQKHVCVMAGDWALSQEVTADCLPQTAHGWQDTGDNPEAAGRPHSHQGCPTEYFHPKISLPSMANQH